MINATNASSLKIVLQNTNKALDKVLQDLNPKELESISQGKDLKSIINSLLKQSSKDTSQDKVLLNLVKNNPTLKNLPSVQTSLKELIDSLSKEKLSTQETVKPELKQVQTPQEKQTQNLLKTLTKFLDQTQDMSKIPVKEKMENSGVFLESKIKNMQTPSQDLKQGLQELSKALQTTQLPSTKEINSQIKTLLKNDIFQNTSSEELFNPKQLDLKSLESLSKKIQALVDEIGKRVASPVDKAISKEDVIFTKDFKQVLEKINLLNKPEQLLSQNKTKEIFSQDFKAVLLKAHEEVSNSSLPNKTELLKQIDKLTLQIDYHQLVSHLSNASSVYVPYSWDALEDGSISIKNTKNGKYFCDINLELKEYGELHLRLGMFEKNQLSINITTQNSEFKSMLQEGIPQLKKQLFSVGINPKDIRFLGDDTFSSYTDTSTNLQMGFEVKA
jgi:endonuclease III